MGSEIPSNMLSVPRPVVVLQRVEEIYPAILREGMIRIDLGSRQNQVIHVELEGIRDDTEEEDREPTTSPLTCCTNCVGLIKVEPDCGCEACVTTLDIGTEEGNIKIEEENPEPIIFQPVKSEPENCIDLRSAELGSHSGMCATSSEAGNEVIRVQLEGVTEVTVQEDREPMMTSSLIRPDPGNCVGLIRDEPDSGSESCVSALDNGSEEGNLEVESVDIREENPATKMSPTKQTEPEGTWNEQLQVHTSEHRYPWKVCSKALNRKNSLIIHTRSHSGERPYCCDVCRKTFTRKENLLIHTRSHSGERPYCCDVCSKAFARKSVLIVHKCLHSGERPYVCRVCSKTFTQKGNMVRHERTHRESCGNLYEEQRDMEKMMNIKFLRTVSTQLQYWVKENLERLSWQK